MYKKVIFLILIFISDITYAQSNIQYKGGKWVLDKKCLFEEFCTQFNLLRDSFNLPRMGFGKTADTIAWEHSGYMARTGEFKHGRGAMDYEQKINYILNRKIDIWTAENLLRLDGFDFSPSVLKIIDKKEFERKEGKTMVSLMFKSDLSYKDFVNQIISDWLKSPGHRKILLSSDYTSFSIAAVCDSKNSFYITYEAQR